MGVKPAFEDVDADGFLAFPFAELKTKSNPTPRRMRIGTWSARESPFKPEGWRFDPSPVLSRVGGCATKHKAFTG